MQTLLGKHWHHLPNQEVVELLDSSQEKGLDLFDIKHRQERFGRNVLTGQKGKTPLQRFLLQFHNPLIYILLASTVITAIFKDINDAAIIFGVVLINAIIGFIQESRAENAIQALAQTMVTETTVLRAGEMQRLPAAELVPGDIVLLKSGDKVPADLRLIQSRDLQVAEAALTGESLPVFKEANLTLEPDTVLAERRNMTYASTLVTYGQGTGIVTATGNYTEVGRISQLISSAVSLETPLTRKISQVSNLLLYIILGLAGITMLIGTIRQQPILDTLLAAIALAVSAIPEGLPAALTITLSIGVARMARRQAIIRKLPAVETLGSTTVICSDKTGTLTQNQMTVQKVVIGQQRYDISGTGYAPKGEITLTGQPVKEINGALEAVLRAGMLCNDSQLVEKNGSWDAQGDPTEVALLVSGRKVNLNLSELNTSFRRVDAIPFESQHQYMATLHSQGENKPRLALVKGSVEALLERSTCAINPDGESNPVDPGSIHQQVDELAQRGLRVLAFASKELPSGQDHLSHADIQTGLTFLGLQAMIDPPRPEAIEAIQACQRAGIRVKMITGDHALTAAAIASQLGLGNGHSGEKLQAMTGKQLAEISDRDLIQVAQNIDVFARVSPEQKLRLVEALQTTGNVVAMTGDGVNDGPALKQADIGIAMGITGTDVAKEAADMVLTNDNFATIRAAVEEGRGVFDNLTKIITWTLPTNIGGGLIILLAVVLGIVLPILPAQVLWINMVAVSVLGLVLAVEQKETDIMTRPPRRPEEPILTKALMFRVVLVGLLISAGAFGLFEWELAQGAGAAAARTVAVNVVIMIEIFYLLNCRSLTRSSFQLGFFSNRWVPASIALMLALQVLYTYAPFMNQFFNSAPIGMDAWIRIFAAGLVSYLVIEIEKAIQRGIRSKKAQAALSNS